MQPSAGLALLYPGASCLTGACHLPDRYLARFAKGPRLDQTQRHAPQTIDFSSSLLPKAQLPQRKGCPATSCHETPGSKPSGCQTLCKTAPAVPGSGQLSVGEARAVRGEGVPRMGIWESCKLAVERKTDGRDPIV